MIPNVRPRHTLILGLGAGTVAHLLTRRFGPVPIVAVDDDAGLVEVARAEFGLNLDILRDHDRYAFAYAEQTKERFDLIHG